MSAARRAAAAGLLLAIAFASPVAGQTALPESGAGDVIFARPGFRECGSRLTPESARLLEDQEAAGLYRLKPPPGGGQVDFVFQVPLTIHIVRRSNGTGGLADSTVNNTVEEASQLFRPLGFEFYRFGNSIFLDSDSLYFRVNTNAEIDVLRQTAVVANTVNVYFTENLSNEEGGLCGIASYTPDAVQGIVMSNTCTTRNGNRTTFAHELGHYFDLFHTHENAFGLECPDGSNCATAGDRLCDTAADPTLADSTVTDDCRYTGTQQRCGQPFSPDPRNLMSYAVPKNCRELLTPQQREKAYAALWNLRPELIPGQAAAVSWVGFEGTAQTGTYTHPWWTVVQGHNLVPANGTLVIKAGTFGENLELYRPMTIDSFRGPVTIGSP